MAMMFYIFNTSYKLIATTDKINQAIHAEEINNENALLLTVTEPDYMDLLVEHNLVGFFDDDEEFQLFRIQKVEDEDNGIVTRDLYAVHIAYDLAYEYVEDIRPTGTAEAILTELLTDSDWEVGTVSDFGSSHVQFYYESIKSGISKIIEAMGGEVRYRLALSGSEITHKYVDILESRGSVTGKRFTYTKDIINIHRTIDMGNVITRCYGFGKGEAIENETGETSYGRRINFNDIVWTIGGGDPVDKPAEQKYVEDAGAIALYGTRTGKAIFDDETDAETVLELTWDYLQTNKEPIVSYELDIMLLEKLSGYSHEAVRLGDIVIAIDKAITPEIKVSARVLRFDKDLLALDQSKVVLGNFVETLTGQVRDNVKVIDRYRDREGTYDDGSMRAIDGLDESGYVGLPIHSEKIVGDDALDGLNLTNTYLGYYNLAQDAWRAYIDKLGNFLFQKDADNYFKFDGTDFEFKGPVIVTGGNAETTTGAQTKVDASQDAIAENMGYTDFADMLAEATAGNTIITGGYLNTILIEAKSILAEHLDVRAVNKVNNYSVTNSAVGWTLTGGGAISLSTGTSKNAPVHVFASDGDVSCFSDKFDIDPTKSYKVTLSVTGSTATGGKRYFGIYVYDKDNVKLSVTPFTVSTRAFGTDTDDPFFWSLAGATGWVNIEGYVMSSNSVEADFPQGLNATKHFKLPSNAAKMIVRYLNFGNAGTTSTVYVYSPSVTEVGSGAIVAENVTAGVLNAARVSIGSTSTFGTGYDPSTKRQNFVATPTTPYYVGDTWTDGTDFKKCKTQRLTGAYSAGDWEAATNYDSTSTTIVGGLITTGTLQVEQGGTVAAGITGNTSGDTATRFWAGSTFANRATAPWTVDQSGKNTWRATVGGKAVKLEMSATNPIKLSIYGTSKYQDYLYVTDNTGFSGANILVTSKYDVNEDGVVDAYDMKLIRDYILHKDISPGVSWPDGYPVDRMDVNDDGKIDSTDLTFVMLNATVKSYLTNSGGSQFGVIGSDTYGVNTYVSDDWGETSTYNMFSRTINIAVSSSKTVTVESAGTFQVFTRRRTVTGVTGIYVADTYLISANRWLITTLSAGTDATVSATGNTTFSIANGSADYTMDVTVVSQDGARFYFS